MTEWQQYYQVLAEEEELREQGVDLDTMEPPVVDDGDDEDDDRDDDAAADAEDDAEIQALIEEQLAQIEKAKGHDG